MQRQELLVELDDGTEHHIVIGNPSLVAFDRTRALRKWPTTKEAPVFWATFVAWHQMKAQGLVSCEFPEFESKVCQGIEFINTKKSKGKGKGKGKPVDPTPQTAEPDSSSPSPLLSDPSVQADVHGLTSPMMP